MAHIQRSIALSLIFTVCYYSITVLIILYIQQVLSFRWSNAGHWGTHSKGTSQFVGDLKNETCSLENLEINPFSPSCIVKFSQLNPYFSLNKLKRIVILIFSNLLCLINSHFLFTKYFILYELCKEKLGVDNWLTRTERVKLDTKNFKPKCSKNHTIELSILDT